MAVPASPLPGASDPVMTNSFDNINGDNPSFSSKVTNWTSARKDAVKMPPKRTLARYLNFSYRKEVRKGQVFVKQQQQQQQQQQTLQREISAAVSAMSH